MYSKPTDGHLYLNYDSCHPQSTKHAVQYGTALRLKRICSSSNEFQKKSKDYKAYLVSCGHNPKEVKETFEKVKNIPRQDARRKREQQEQNEKKHRFITHFNPHHPNINQIIKRHEDILRTNATLNRIFPPSSFQVVNKREQNLKEKILRADPYSVKNRTFGIYKTCKRCDSCKTFTGCSDITQFTSSATGQSYKIMKNMDCNTPNAIYLAECKKCKKQGVGSTRNWKPRVANYKSWVKHNLRKCRIASHFIDTCRGQDHSPWSNMQFYIIDCLDNYANLSDEKIEDELLRKEKFWIRKLVTYHQGLNSSHDLNRSKRCEPEQIE